MDSNFDFVTRQDILNFPFPYKLWLVVNLEYCDFLRWNRDGTVVLLDLVTLEEYLNSTRSIFKIKNSSNFLKHLVEFKFERLNSTPEEEEDVLLQYKNEHFQRHRLDLLAKIRRHTYQLIGDNITNNSEQCFENATSSCDKASDQCTSIPKLVSERMLGDLCFMCHGGLSSIKKSRLHFQTTLHFDSEKRILKEKLDESGQRCRSTPDTSGRSATVSSISEEDQVIEVPVELFENPHDSVLNFDFLPEYAGYYGNCTKDQILNFFGEYLPMYEDGSMEVKKIATDNGNNLLTVNTETNIAQYHSPNTAVNSNVIISTPVALNTIYDLNFSSNLEPIFIPSDNCEDININNINSDLTVTHLNSNNDDISMDEFLKFKDSRSEDSSVNTHITGEESGGFGIDNSMQQEEENTKQFPQMPVSFKMEINEDLKENEANFRNFFSQYRTSMNLLYDHQ